MCAASVAHVSHLDARQLWKQTAIPIVFDDKAGGRLLVKIPYTPFNRAWLKQDHTRAPEWLKQFQCWRVPRAWLEDVTKRLCRQYGRVYVIHPYREREQ